MTLGQTMRTWMLCCIMFSAPSSKSSVNTPSNSYPTDIRHGPCTPCQSIIYQLSPIQRPQTPFMLCSVSSMAHTNISQSVQAASLSTKPIDPIRTCLLPAVLLRSISKVPFMDQFIFDLCICVLYYFPTGPCALCKALLTQEGSHSFQSIVEILNSTAQKQALLTNLSILTNLAFQSNLKCPYPSQPIVCL